MAKTKQPKAPREKKPKQAYLDPDLAPPSVPEIDGAAEAYVEARDDRMAKLKEETECQDRLLALMEEHKLKTYSFDGRVVNVNELKKVSVVRAKAEQGSE